MPAGRHSVDQCQPAHIPPAVHREPVAELILRVLRGLSDLNGSDARRAAAKFLQRYQDRVLWGTDLTPDRQMYMSWWRL